MPTVYFSSETNSTFFTTCCHVPIWGNDDLCPKCKEEVLPKGHKARYKKAYNRNKPKYERYYE